MVSAAALTAGQRWARRPASRADPVAQMRYEYDRSVEQLKEGAGETLTIMGGSGVGKSVAETSWPPGCVPAAVVRASQVLPASTETRLSPGDKLICLTDVAQAEALHHLVAHPAGPSGGAHGEM